MAIQSLQYLAEQYAADEPRAGWNLIYVARLLTDADINRVLDDPEIRETEILADAMAEVQEGVMLLAARHTDTTGYLQGLQTIFRVNIKWEIAARLVPLLELESADVRLAVQA